MILFKNIIPYKFETDLPGNILDLIDSRKIDDDSIPSNTACKEGWGDIIQNELIIKAEDKLLLKHVIYKRTVNKKTVDSLVNERLSEMRKDSEQKRNKDIEEQIVKDLKDQAYNECLKYAPVSKKETYLIIDKKPEKTGYIYASASTRSQAEKALSYLRATISRSQCTPIKIDLLKDKITHYLINRKTEFSVPLSDNLEIPIDGMIDATGKYGETLKINGVDYSDNMMRLLNELTVNKTDMKLVTNDSIISFCLNAQNDEVIIEQYGADYIKLEDTETYGSYYIILRLISRDMKQLIDSLRLFVTGNLEN